MTTLWKRASGFVLVCLLALALRVHRLAEPLMRWDESWSVAHASLSWLEIVRISSWEVHPPFFYLLFKPWVALGRDVFLVRFFPVLVGLLAVPLTFRVAMCWMGRRRLAWLAAGLAAVAPALVYYAQVVRMYPLVVCWVLLAAWALLYWLDRGGKWALVGLVAAGLAALYTFYYTAWALAGLYGYGLLVARRGARRPVKELLAAGVATLALYLPWLAYAGAGMLQRVAQAAPDATVMPVTPWDLLASTWMALTFDFGSGGWAALVVLAVLLAALLVRRSERAEREETSRLLMPILAVLTSAGGVVLGSGAYFFAPRLLTPGVPFLLLLVAWALDRLGRLRRGFLFAGLAVLLVAFWPTSSRFVYEKNLEVSGDFDPHEYHAMLSSQARPDDFVFFNELALAGWYEMDRTPEDPAWGYTLRWTPIIEPMENVRSRVERAATDYARLWFVLYQGTFGPGAELKTWLDGTLYPYSMDWGSDSLFLSYLALKPPWLEVAPGQDFGDVIRLEAARYSAQAGPAGEVGVVLRWRALQAPLPDYRVVLQIWDETGVVLAHRDVRPANEERPTHRWVAGEVVEDHHGLLLTGRRETPLHLAVSLYDADTGEILPIAGGTFLELGVLNQ
jgi:4-amino-4-deoxy-L-arabinose transferase-like glycosyltransferase